MNVKKFLLLMGGLASLILVMATSPIYVHLGDGTKDTYNTSFVDSLYATTQKQYLNLKFPASDYEIVSDDESEGPVLKLSETNLEADRKGCEFNVKVTSDTDFAVKEQPDWCGCIISGNIITIKVKPNVSGEAREGVIVVANADLEASVSIHQENLIEMVSALPSIEEIIDDIEWNPSATEAEKELVLGIVNNLVCVQGSNFYMGAQANRDYLPNYDSQATANEQPVHDVNISSFYIDKYELTQKEWKVLMENRSYFSSDENLPAETISWNDANQFIEKLNAISSLKFSLPTEAQWEYAARGGINSNGYIYSGSNDPLEVAWFSGNANLSTHVGGQLAPNELGIYDMSGNVYEWTSDWMGDYSDENGCWNPTGPATGTEKIGRGGTQIFDASYQRVAKRMSTDPDSRSFMGVSLLVGVRVALEYSDEVSVNLNADSETIIVNLETEDQTGQVTIPDGLDWCNAYVSDGKMYVTVQTNRSSQERYMDFLVETHTKRLLVHVSQDFKETTLSDVIPDELADLIESGTITYNPGFNPPNVEGCYYVVNQTVVASSLGSDDIGYTACSAYINLFNQTSSNLIDCKMYETAGTNSWGPGAFLTGEGSLFSAFFNMEGEYDDGETTFKEAIIISGEKTAQGIKDYRFTFVLIDKYDPYSQMVPVGTFRSFVEDSDGLAENSSWPLRSHERWLAPEKKSSLPAAASNSLKK